MDSDQDQIQLPTKSGNGTAKPSAGTGSTLPIQSALSIADPDKREQETASLIRIPDSFSKIVIVRDYIKPWRDEKGILYLGLEQFLLDEQSIDL